MDFPDIPETLAAWSWPIRLASLVKEVAVFGAVVEFFHHGVVCWEENGAKNDK